MTTTSANGLSITTQTDSTGSGSFDQTQTDVTVLNADGSKTETVSDFSANGSLEDQDRHHDQRRRPRRSPRKTDSTGNGAFDQIRTDVTVLNADGSQTETVTDTSANGTLEDRTVTYHQRRRRTPVSIVSELSAGGRPDRDRHGGQEWPPDRHHN